MNNDPVIHFYLDEESEALRWRRRTTFLVAVIGEVLFLFFVMFASHWFARHRRSALLEAEQEKPQQQTTFLVMPPDLLKELRKPKTNNLSDKNRLAHGPSPVVKPNGLRMPYLRGNTHLPKLAGGSPPPPPKQMTPPPAPRANPATEAAQPPKEVAKAEPPPEPKPPKQQEVEKPKLTLSDIAPAHTPNRQVASQLGIVTPSQAIQQSLREAARGRSMGEIPGPGLSREQLNNLNPNFSTSGPIILSDTRGVDFGPYLAQILMIVRQNWYAVIPESARLGERGRVAIVFEILKDGSVPQLRLIGPSGKPPLDRAAIAGIRASIPFPPLPREFTGNHLVLQFNFFYNMRP
ncbi:MAG TPA: TonB family protein [Terriglobia bacterium]|nr:TonB family protein [Terriglobia bacterium]